MAWLVAPMPWTFLWSTCEGQEMRCSDIESRVTDRAVSSGREIVSGNQALYSCIMRTTRRIRSWGWSRTSQVPALWL